MGADPKSGRTTQHGAHERRPGANYKGLERGNNTLKGNGIVKGTGRENGGGKETLVAVLAGEFQWSPGRVGNTLNLLDEGNTVPFIARYRKEMTGSLDEVQLRDLWDRAVYLRDLEERRSTVLESITGQERLTPELEQRILSVTSKQELEDLYLPYRPKRRTRATMAREKGLGPLADSLFQAGVSDAAADAAVRAFVSASAGTDTAMDEKTAWAGCRDIMAETVAEDAATRAWMRGMTWRDGTLESRAARGFMEKKTKFKDYYQFSEPLRSIPAHRYLALRRGESEKVLKVGVSAPSEDILTRLEKQWVRDAGQKVREQWGQMLDDAYTRLIAPSIELELRLRLKETADKDSIAIFAENLNNLLLQAPGGRSVVLGLDPGFRTGSKWVVVDATGRVLAHGSIFPLPPQNRAGEAAKLLKSVFATYRVEVVAIGNGTAARELMAFVKQTVPGPETQPRLVMVSEAGASVYSASDLAREEFPDLDVTIRGAVSIARRWQDPLAELVKIDPKSIGVGQYQHDVQQGLLKKALDETVESCVNQVGVNLNSASWALLRYVAGVGPALAKELVLRRDAQGPFQDRAQLLEVPRMGALAYRQCAGFLRIPEGRNPLDRSAVHPDHYPIVERMAADLGVELSGLVGDPELAGKIDLEAYITGEVGRPTLEDILAELAKPGRDPRPEAEAVRFHDDITEIGHIRPGQRLNGVVTNITHFGAFVDVGVHQDGLVHISQLADKYVKNPHQVVRVGQAVQVRVLSVDLELGRIGLSMKKNPEVERPKS